MKKIAMTITSLLEKTELGKAATQSDIYDPNRLQAIPRAAARDPIRVAR